MLTVTMLTCWCWASMMLMFSILFSVVWWYHMLNSSKQKVPLRLMGIAVFHIISLTKVIDKLKCLPNGARWHHKVWVSSKLLKCILRWTWMSESNLVAIHLIVVQAQNYKCQPPGGKRKVRESPKSLGFKAWGPWMSVQNVMAIYQDISVWTKVVDWLTLQFKESCR